MADSYVITCCSTADMPASYMEAHSIPYARFHFRMDGREYEDDLGASISFEEFYKKIDEGAMPTTAQVNPEQYRALFEPILAEGKDGPRTAGSRGRPFRSVHLDYGKPHPAPPLVHHIGLDPFPQGRPRLRLRRIFRKYA